METFDVIIIGGGPAGSSCAWQLRKHGIEPLVLDRAEFPRLKLCAGWITPQVVRDLEFDPAEYPHSFMTFPSIRTHLGRWSFDNPDPQHSIRRIEFDAWLLERSGAEVRNHYVKDIREEDGHFILDDTYRCKYLVGAGGTRCPVYRTIFQPVNPRASELQIVTLEHEFTHDWADERCHLWFFVKGLPGYQWYVPKANGALNIGVGATADDLSRKGTKIRDHWAGLVETLDKDGLLRNYAHDPSGFSYYLRGNVETTRVGNAFIVGDSAGLATRDLGEGIGPAVQSGMRAADTIANGADFDLHDLDRYSLTNSNFLGGLLERILR